MRRRMNDFLSHMCYDAPDSGSEGSAAGDVNGSDDILDLFNSEFGSSDEGTGEQAPVEQNQASSTETPVQPAEPEPAPAVEPTVETPKVEETPKEDPLALQAKALADAQATIKALQDQINSQKTVNQEPVATKDPVFENDPAELYNYQIPNKLYTALFSSESTPEERVLALQGFAKAISVNTHRQIMNSLGNWTKENFNAVPKVVDYLLKKNQEVSKTQSTIKKQFYEEFPDLQRAELAPLLKATIKQVQAETKATAWSPAFQTQVGTRIRALLQSFAPKQPVSVPPTVVPTAVKPAPTVKTTDPNSADAIAATLADFY